MSTATEHDLIALMDKIARMLAPNHPMETRALLAEFAAAIREDTLAFVREDAKLAIRSAPDMIELNEPPPRTAIAQAVFSLCPKHTLFFHGKLIRAGVAIPFDDPDCCDFMEYATYRLRTQDTTREMLT